jgi:hypothetical protein
VASDVPDQLTLARNRDREGKREVPWRRAGVVVLGLFLAAALANAFGQRPETRVAGVPEASLKIYAPARVRSGLFFETRFTIHALRELKDANVVLSSGWLEGMTLNTVEPSPIGESSRDGSPAFDLGHIRAGDKYILFLQFQVNPTNVGRRSQIVDLYDGKRRLLTIRRQITVFP